MIMEILLKYKLRVSYKTWDSINSSNTLIFFFATDIFIR